MAGAHETGGYRPECRTSPPQIVWSHAVTGAVEGDPTMGSPIRPCSAAADTTCALWVLDKIQRSIARMTFAQLRLWTPDVDRPLAVALARIPLS